VKEIILLTKANVKLACHAHTNINVLDGITGLLDRHYRGPIGVTQNEAFKTKVIALCKKEQSRLLNVYDANR